MNSVLLLIEIAFGAVALLSLSKVSKQHGTAAATAVGIGGVLALMDAARRLSASKTGQAISLFTGCSLFLLVVTFFVPAASTFFSGHRTLLWATPLLAGLAWASAFRILALGFWALLAWVWIQGVGLDSAVPRWLRTAQANREWRLANTHDLYAPKVEGEDPWCGALPDGEIRCCDDNSQNLVVEYVGSQSPYDNLNVKYSFDCKS